MRLKVVEISRYTEEFRAEWDNLVEVSINGTFLHQRDFLEYHGERFGDYSLLALAAGKLVAVLPAETENGKVSSHRGLSYGGWVFGLGIDSETVRAVVLEGFNFLKEGGFESLYIRSIPAFYFTEHFSAVQAIYRQFGIKTASKTFQTIVPPFTWKDKGRRWGLHKAQRSGMQVSNDARYLEDFWDKVLCPNLWMRHQAKPVHSVAEMQTLMVRFPNEIKLYTAVLEGEVLAGVLVFCTKRGIHAQYIANGPKGRQLRALDLLMHHLMFGAYADMPFLSLGISNEPSTGEINRGLYAWKQSLGAIDFEEWDYEFRLQETPIKARFT
ncbi:GNAT family N-acetyltransferase [Mariniradius sediminis]|uniref:GNAT family N-acetyltransferase n=1 Tax=Mariniradius sediminis TaxID=2909237 RepID=A0ABS9C0C4_9BACT|nr:GNAT family N-acetyltransferase [Mariniradius sediminis]MCF1753376.1 GNAT family N-acetyltransferase [Mariniradius sediminis]